MRKSFKQTKSMMIQRDSRVDQATAQSETWRYSDLNSSGNDSCLAMWTTQCMVTLRKASATPQ